MTRHGPRVAQTEIDVVVSVDVPEAAALSFVDETGNPPTQRVIQFIGTPANNDERARSKSVLDLGCSRSNRARSWDSRLSTLFLSISVIALLCSKYR